MTTRGSVALGDVAILKRRLNHVRCPAPSLALSERQKGRIRTYPG
jgi:hypothetical protein